MWLTWFAKIRFTSLEVLTNAATRFYPCISVFIRGFFTFPVNGYEMLSKLFVEVNLRRSGSTEPKNYSLKLR